MHVGTHCEATKKSPKGPFREVASECVSRILFLHLHAASKAGHATLKSHYKKKCVFTRTRSINLFQYRGVLAYRCLSICMSAHTVRPPKNQVASECVSRILFLHLHAAGKAGHATLKSHYKKNVCSPELGPLICFNIEGF